MIAIIVYALIALVIITVGSISLDWMVYRRRSHCCEPLATCTRDHDCRVIGSGPCNGYPKQ